jgi:hypothetical protein
MTILARAAWSSALGVGVSLAGLKARSFMWRGEFHQARSFIGRCECPRHSRRAYSMAP